MKSLTVEFLQSSRIADYFRVSRGKEGGPPCTVRMGLTGKWVCLTCIRGDCIHCQAADEFDRDRSPRDVG